MFGIKALGRNSEEQCHLFRRSDAIFTLRLSGSVEHNIHSYTRYRYIQALESKEGTVD